MTRNPSFRHRGRAVAREMAEAIHDGHSHVSALVPVGLSLLCLIAGLNAMRYDQLGPLGLTVVVAGFVVLFMVALAYILSALVVTGGHFLQWSAASYEGHRTARRAKSPVSPSSSTASGRGSKSW